ncbi:hypothetical protein QWA_02860 [Alcaligenes faecalis subsp. faecalis NCIB 8687]|jgi:hypothetical protein|uniref:Uncharacterized protein n=2 Tax=Alcaligenes TaxID=507 RepID=A0ABX8SSM5_9BURK|nr:hypothetical protein QWA_02860 [Alcaligenes faecalis subsp. faecalis NCIB 8687]QBH21089.1 hypothetical protein EYC51_17215 [Alcaligenes faecalis]QXX79038.1 hypothetical protein FE795_08415 [Alcaligenes ammonioxydans]
MDHRKMATLTKRAGTGLSALCRELTSRGISYHPLVEMYQSQMAVIGLLSDEVVALRKELDDLKKVVKKNGP